MNVADREVAKVVKFCIDLHDKTAKAGSDKIVQKRPREILL